MQLTPDLKDFIKLSGRGNLVPVWTELLADQETPVAAYERVRNYLRQRNHASHTYLLESVEGGENVGRYSFIGGLPRAILRSYGRRTEVTTDEGQQVLRDMDPLAALKSYMQRFRPVPDPDLPRFIGGAVGFLGYDCVAQFENVPLCGCSDASAQLNAPDMVMMVTDALIIFDRVKHSLRIVANAYINDNPEDAYARAVATIASLREALQAPLPQPLIETRPEPEAQAAESNMTRAEFEAAVEKARQYISAGDIIQTVLAQRFSVDFEGDSLDVYRALRSVNPSPYMFCLDMGGSAMIGSSPEIHVRCEHGRIEVRPIAGTRPRSLDPVEDQRLEAELLADPKERAEHIMLVDLARNDIGRVSEYGSVETPELMVVERYSHVMHLVSDVIGTLRADMDSFDVMRATFPAGTVSGAPKIRAMEIIAELEKARRGPYAGAVGYFSFDGNLDSCITIRTIILDTGRAWVQAGAGIVADSQPAMEYEETRNKARGMLKALALAKRIAVARKEQRLPYEKPTIMKCSDTGGGEDASGD